MLTAILPWEQCFNMAQPFSKEFAKAYLMKPKFAEAHDNGDIHIHDMDFLPMGTTTCCQIDIRKTI